MEATEQFRLEGTLGSQSSAPAVPASQLDCTSKLDDFAWGHSCIFPREESGPQVYVQHMLHYLSLCHL